MTSPASTATSNTPPNRLVDLGGYIEWYMHEEHSRRPEPSVLGLVLRMEEWQKIVDALASNRSAIPNTPSEKWPDDFPKVEGRTEFGTYYVTVRPHTDEAIEKCVQTQCAVSLDYGPNRLLLGFEVFDIPEEK